jgi:hypothetical protein
VTGVQTCALPISNLYGMKNITFFQDSFFNVVNNTSQNIIYIDPFSGKPEKDIVIEGKYLNEVVEEIKPYANMIVLKVSSSSNVSGLMFNDMEDMKYYKLIVIIPHLKMPPPIKKIRQTVLYLLWEQHTMTMVI